MIVPSILSLGSAQIKPVVRILEKNFRILQIDVMDGFFVPRKVFSPLFVKKLKTKMIKEAHLMVRNPGKLINSYIKAGSESILFHIEAVENPKKVDSLIKTLKKKKIKAGIAINPETSIKKIIPYLKKINKILVMTVHPGKGGQKLLPSTIKKIKKIRSLNKKVVIEVDGGINKSNIKKVIRAGATHIVIGSSLVNGDLKENIKAFKRLIK